LGDKLRRGAQEVQAITGISNTYTAPRDALLANVRDALTHYGSAETTIAAAVAKMQTSARKIVADTNAQIKTPTISPGTATGLLKSNIAVLAPSSPVTASCSGGQKSAADDSAIVEKMNALTTDLNAFLGACVRPQPASLAAFDACTTYSPAVPPAPTITTVPVDTKVTLKPGDTYTFVATSSPTGTPWASYGSNLTVAQQSLGQVQQLTVAPNQTQVSVTYNKDKPVTADAQVIVNLIPLGVSASTTPVTLTLKAAEKPAATTDPAAGVEVPSQAGKLDYAAIKKDAALMTKLGLAATASDASVRAALETQWRAACAANASAKPTDAKLSDKAFLDAVKGGAKPDAKQAFCKT